MTRMQQPLIPTLVGVLRPTTDFTGPVSIASLSPFTRALVVAWCLLCLAAASLTVRAVVTPWTELP